MRRGDDGRVQQLYDNLEIDLGRIAENMAGKKIHLVVGPTGSGKSTLICYLLGVPLKRIKESSFFSEGESFFVVDPDRANDRLIRPEIGQEIHSQTIAPQTYYMDRAIGAGPLLCDTGGFFDNRSKEIRAQVQLGLSTACKAINRVQSVIVCMTFQSLKDPKLGLLIETADILQETFSMSGHFDPDVAFVFSRVNKRVTKDMLLEHIGKITSKLDVRYPLHLKAYNLFRIMLTHPEHVFIERNLAHDDRLRHDLRNFMGQTQGISKDHLPFSSGLYSHDYYLGMGSRIADLFFTHHGSLVRAKRTIERLQQHMNETSERIAGNEKTLRETHSMKPDDAESYEKLTEKYNERIAHLESKVKEAERDEKLLKKQIDVLQKKKFAMLTDTTPLVVTNQTYTEPRGSTPIKPNLTRTHRFDYAGEAPIIDMQHKTVDWSLESLAPYRTATEHKVSIKREGFWNGFLRFITLAIYSDTEVVHVVSRADSFKKLSRSLKACSYEYTTPNVVYGHCQFTVSIAKKDSPDTSVATQEIDREREGLEARLTGVENQMKEYQAELDLARAQLNTAVGLERERQRKIAVLKNAIENDRASIEQSTSNIETARMVIEKSLEELVEHDRRFRLVLKLNHIYPFASDAINRFIEEYAQFSSYDPADDFVQMEPVLEESESRPATVPSYVLYGPAYAPHMQARAVFPDTVEYGGGGGGGGGGGSAAGETEVDERSPGYVASRPASLAASRGLYRTACATSSSEDGESTDSTASSCITGSVEGDAQEPTRSPSR